jgi:hypothetical protein
LALLAQRLPADKSSAFLCMTPFPSAAIIATFVKRRRVNGLTLLEILVSGCLFFFNVQRVNARKRKPVRGVPGNQRQQVAVN